MAKKRRSPGAGSIEKLPSGKFRIRLTGSDGKKCSSETFLTYEEADQMRKNLLATLLQKNSYSRGGLTLRQWAIKWFGRRNNRSVKTDENNLSNHVLTSELADMTLAEISRKDIKDFLYDLQKKKALVPVKGGGMKPSERSLSESTQKLVAALLKKCFSDAVEEGLLKENVAKGIQVAKQSVAGQKWNYLKKEEIHKILSCEKIPQEFRLIYQFAIYTGMRKGELWPLRWDDVELDSTYPKISISRSKDAGTKGANRTIPLLRPALEALLTWKHACPSDEFVFPKADGEKRAGGYTPKWKKHKEFAGISRRIRFHDLRHTCATHLVMGTWGPAWGLYEVQNFLGHEDMSTTQIYAHLSPEHLHKKAQQTFENYESHMKPTPAVPSWLLPTMELRGIEPLTSRMQIWTSSQSSQTLPNQNGLHMDLEAQNQLKYLSFSLLYLAAANQPLPPSLLLGLASKSSTLFKTGHPAHFEINRIQSGGVFQNSSASDWQSMCLLYSKRKADRRKIMGRACFALTFPKCKLLCLTPTVCAKNTLHLNKWIRSLSESRMAIALLILRDCLGSQHQLSLEQQKSTEFPAVRLIPSKASTISLISVNKEPKKHLLAHYEASISTKSYNCGQKISVYVKLQKKLGSLIRQYHGYFTKSKKISKQKHELVIENNFFFDTIHQIGYLLFIPNGGNQ